MIGEKNYSLAFYSFFRQANKSFLLVDCYKFKFVKRTTSPTFSSTFPLLLLLSIRVAPNPRSSTKSTISSGVTSSGKYLTSAFPAINPTSIDTIPSSLPACGTW